LATRRDVLMGGPAILALTAITGPLAGARTQSGPDTSRMLGSPYKVVFDQRQPTAQSFAHRAAAMGYTVYGLADDPTSLWYDDLYHRWRDAPVAVAGMTTEHVALCLKLYAQDAGLREVYSGKHRLGQDGVAEHHFHSSVPVTRATLLERYDWSEDVVRLISSADTLPTPRRQFMVRGGDTAGLQTDQSLVSWLFAPIRRT